MFCCALVSGIAGGGGTSTYIAYLLNKMTVSPH